MLWLVFNLQLLRVGLLGVGGVVGEVVVGAGICVFIAGFCVGGFVYRS